MNIKKLERDFNYYFENNIQIDMKPLTYAQRKAVKVFLFSSIHKLIKQIIESVPVEKRKPLIKPDPYKCLGGLKIDTTDFNRDIGYNQHIKVIKQWKKDILKELKKKK